MNNQDSEQRDHSYENRVYPRGNKLRAIRIRKFGVNDLAGVFAGTCIDDRQGESSYSSRAKSIDLRDVGALY